MRLLVTGGAGFIGSAVVRRAVGDGHDVVTVDKLTYAGHLASLAAVDGHPRHRLVRADIADRAAMDDVFGTFRPDAVFHLAAESHVDRSIDAPDDFVRTNVVGTATLLEAARVHATDAFRFVHVSTDEVYGPMAEGERSTEDSPYRPSSPYAASKAASDHLVRAWHRTYGLPTIVTHCSNNLGPYQLPEKLIPLMVLSALQRRPLPVYGHGEHVRDWLHVDDHVDALFAVLDRGEVGTTYDIGADARHANLDVVERVCDLLDALAPDATLGPRRQLVRFVDDRPGHDARYAVDASRIRRELGWAPRTSFEAGLEATVRWYLAEADGWCRQVQDDTLRRRGLGAP